MVDVYMVETLLRESRGFAVPAVEVGRRKQVAGRNSATCTEKGEQTRNHLEVVMRSDPTFELTQGLWNVGQGLQFDELQGPCVP